uniref:Uncharacterized protein n=1 Tax=candidate division WOR-3 bacterium TaxID=2052148 RepID=A0A7V3ZST4_UNCW3
MNEEKINEALFLRQKLMKIDVVVYEFHRLYKDEKYKKRLRKTQYFFTAKNIEDLLKFLKYHYELAKDFVESYEILKKAKRKLRREHENEQI